MSESTSDTQEVSPAFDGSEQPPSVLPSLDSNPQSSELRMSSRTGGTTVSSVSPSIGRSSNGVRRSHLPGGSVRLLENTSALPVQPPTTLKPRLGGIEKSGNTETELDRSKETSVSSSSTRRKNSLPSRKRKMTATVSMGTPKRVKLDLVPREWTEEEAGMICSMLSMIETCIAVREGQKVTRYCCIEQHGLDQDGKVIDVEPRCKYCGEYARRKGRKYVIGVCKAQEKHPGAYGYGSK